MAKSEKMKTISSERLKYAREYYGISIQEVSQRSKISSDDLEKYENGQDYPSYAKLELLSNIYNRPLLFFFFQSPPPKEDLSVKFRSIERRVSTALDMQTRLMIEKAQLYQTNLRDLFNDSPAPHFSSALKENNVIHEDDLIAWLRNNLDLPIEKQKNEFQKPEELLEYLREQLYELGVYIFKDSFRKDFVSGLCLYDESFPVILLNNKTSFTRQIFTVFHEIYHIFAKESDVFFYGDQVEERACDKFASKLLIPETDFNNRIKEVSSFERKELIEDIARDYKASPTAIAYRLLVKGKISRDFYLSIQDDGIRRITSFNSGGNYYYTRISYLGRPYLKRVLSNYYSGSIGIATVSKYTGLKAAHISKLSSHMFGGAL